MNTLKKIVLVVVLFALMFVWGCANTFHEFGSLMKGVGEDIQMMSKPYLAEDNLKEKDKQ